MPCPDSYDSSFTVSNLNFGPSKYDYNLYAITGVLSCVVFFMLNPSLKTELMTSANNFLQFIFSPPRNPSLNANAGAASMKATVAGKIAKVGAAIASSAASSSLSSSSLSSSSLSPPSSVPADPAFPSSSPFANIFGSASSPSKCVGTSCTPNAAAVASTTTASPFGSMRQSSSAATSGMVTKLGAVSARFVETAASAIKASPQRCLFRASTIYGHGLTQVHLIDDPHARPGKCENYRKITDKQRVTCGETADSWLSKHSQAVIMVFARWCPHCHNAMPELAKNAKKYNKVDTLLLHHEVLPSDFVKDATGHAISSFPHFLVKDCDTYLPMKDMIEAYSYFDPENADMRVGKGCKDGGGGGEDKKKGGREGGDKLSLIHI